MPPAASPAPVAASVPSPQSSVAKLGRHPELDGVRGLAVLLVVLWHYVGFLVGQTPLLPASFFTIPLQLTWSGVDLFFVLSGYLICRQLWAPAPRRMPAGRFFANRLRRILPLYYLLLVVYFAGRSVAWPADSTVSCLFDGPVPGWMYLTLTQNFGMAAVNDWGGLLLAVTWSLAIEMQFYLLAPVFARLLSLRALPWACAAGLGVVLAFRHFNPQFESLFPRWSHPGLQSYVLLPWHGAPILAGAFIAWAELSGALARLRLVWLQAVCVLSGAGLWWFGWRVSTDAFHFNYLYLAVFYGSLVLCLLRAPATRLGAFFRQPWLCFCGLISYGIYLLHLPVSILLEALLPGLSLLQTFVLSAFATGALAAASYFFFERRFLVRGRPAPSGA